MLRSACSFARLALFASFASFVACSSESEVATPPAPDEAAPNAPSTTRPSEPSSPEKPTDPNSCTRTTPTADVARKVVISHPYGKQADEKANAFEVLDLSLDGKLTKSGVTFEMGRAFESIAFTPDGAIGLVAQEDGSIGVFAFDSSGKVRVVHAAFKGPFYAHRIVVAKTGDRAFVLDEQTDNNGGGVHEVSIACGGELTYVGLVVPGGRAHAMALVPSDPNRAVFVGYKAIDSKDGDYVHLLDVADAKQPKRLASGNAFGDDEAIASSVAVTHDGKYALVTDNGFTKGSRMVAVNLATMTSLPVVSTPNPAQIVVSPFDDAALLLNSDGEDALRVVKYDATKQSPFSAPSEIAYVGGKTSLPTVATVIERGALKGTVLVLEVTAVRTLTFATGGTVTDHGTLDFGEGYESITGALGVQP